MDPLSMTLTGPEVTLTGSNSDWTWFSLVLVLVLVLSQSARPLLPLTCSSWSTAPGASAGRTLSTSAASWRRWPERSRSARTEPALAWSSTATTRGPSSAWTNTWPDPLWWRPSARCRTREATPGQVRLAGGAPCWFYFLLNHHTEKIWNFLNSYSVLFF